MRGSDGNGGGDGGAAAGGYICVWWGAAPLMVAVARCVHGRWDHASRVAEQPPFWAPFRYVKLLVHSTSFHAYFHSPDFDGIFDGVFIYFQNYL